jgi:hypothetical protein
LWISSFVLPLSPPYKFLYLCWNLGVKNLSTCALSICIRCIKLSSLWRFGEVKVHGLLLTGACTYWVLGTLDGLLAFCGVVDFCGVVTLVVITWEPPIIVEFASRL